MVHEWHGLCIRSNSPLPQPNDPHWTIVGIRDFDRDGDLDFLWQYPGHSALVFWEMQGNRFYGNPTYNLPTAIGGLDWQLMQILDLHQDGSPDLLYRHQQTGALKVLLINDFHPGSILNFPPQLDPHWELILEEPY
ncbi:MAG: VCBS repeat-containing protein [Synechococcales bacterium]|nr:VCBS repeat-containing protein [Synechococcales bacterium]